MHHGIGHIVGIPPPSPDTSDPPPPPPSTETRTVTKRAVCILLECCLVINDYCSTETLRVRKPEITRPCGLLTKFPHTTVLCCDEMMKRRKKCIVE